MGSVNLGIPKGLVSKIAAICDIRSFIETGTFVRAPAMSVDQKGSLQFIVGNLSPPATRYMIVSLYS